MTSNKPSLIIVTEKFWTVRTNFCNFSMVKQKESPLSFFLRTKAHFGPFSSWDAVWMCLREREREQKIHPPRSSNMARPNTFWLFDEWTNRRSALFLIAISSKSISIAIKFSLAPPAAIMASFPPCVLLEEDNTRNDRSKTERNDWCDRAKVLDLNRIRHPRNSTHCAMWIFGILSYFRQENQE